jgi:hypothetical protein
MVAVVRLVIELGPFPVERYLCDQHQDGAKELAERFQAVAYRMVLL